MNVCGMGVGVACEYVCVCVVWMCIWHMGVTCGWQDFAERCGELFFSTRHAHTLHTTPSDIVHII